jgi:hypothetical protein
MPDHNPIFRGAFPAGALDEFSGRGVRPVVFDIIAPDGVTSILPDDLKLVLHVNPKSMSVKYQKIIERTQTKSGFVEQHFGDGTQTLDFDMATGGFMRLWTGLSANTSPTMTGGTRRETLAYNSYLDILALFHNNGSVYDIAGQVALQGKVKVTFDGGVFFGWFTSFTVNETADQPFQFTLSASFEVESEVQTWRTAITLSNPLSTTL